ncbi:MAG TPA: hypothetical protein VER58_00160 [Thermoanaerobaculia bacterium]|nr:hypothetical protein [Thermoanaerobaculia bacterium]
MKAKVAVATILFVIAGFPATGAMRVTRDGVTVPAAELCYYAAAGTENPFVQQFASNRVNCSPTLPPGRWNVYARQGTQFISARVVLSDTPDAELRLEPAATIELPRAGGVYLTDTISFFPGAGKILVPAERDLVPMLVENKKMIGVAPIVHPHAGETIRVSSFASRALVTWLSIAPADLEALRAARKPRPPTILANQKVKPINPIVGTINLDKAIQIFSDLPDGDVIVTATGVPWRGQEMRARQENRVVMLDQPLRLLPSSSLIVEWYTTVDLASLSERLVSDCKKTRVEAETTFALSLLKCSGIDRDRCVTIKESDISVNERAGRVAFDDLDPLQYLLEFRYRNLVPLRRAIAVRKFDQVLERFPVDYSTLFGKVTVGGKEPERPIRIDFDWNGPPSAMTDAHGEYFAVIEKPPAKDRVLRLRTCNGATDASYIVDRDVAPNSRFDIDLPSNKITVEAVDAKSGAPVAGARVRYGAFRSDEMSSTYYFRLAIENDAPAHTDRDGQYTIVNLSPDKTIHICLEHDDYERTCPETFKVTSTETKTLRVPMQPRNAFHGRVIGPQSIAGGQIYWFSPDGQQAESVPASDDGTFRFNREHGPDEVLVLVSINLPLFIQRQPMLHASDALDIAIPAAPSRSFEVSISEQAPQTDALITIAIGDLIVPYPAFSQHLALHGSMLAVRNRGPLLVPDILETAPISVLLGPPPSTVVPSRNDIFRLPQYRGVPRKPVTGTMVVFSAPGSPVRGQSKPASPESTESSAWR